MSCTLTQGYSLECNSSSGGVDILYISGAEKGVTYLPASGSNILEGYDGESSTYSLSFQKFEQEIETAAATESVSADRTTGTVFYEQSVELTVFYGSDSASNDTIRDTLLELVKGNMAIIVKEQSGIYRLYGAKNGLRVTEGTGGTGKAFGDLNGLTVTLSGKEPEPAHVITPNATPTGGTEPLGFVLS